VFDPIDIVVTAHPQSHMFNRFGFAQISMVKKLSDCSTEKVSKTSQPSHCSENVTSTEDLVRTEKKKGAEEPLYLTRYE